MLTELFRDWNSPLASKGRELFNWYVGELQKLEAKR
jgi:hypothetical protein